jgi:hypothetical protein
MLELRSSFKFDDGRIYTGEWNIISNLREGFGQTIRSDGDYFEGFFKNNKANGICKDFYDNRYYDGEMKDGLKGGEGKLIFDSGNYYEGEYKEDEMEGSGFYRFNEGNNYKG